MAQRLRFSRASACAALALVIFFLRPAASGNNHRNPTGPPPIPPVLSITDMGTVTQNPVILGRDGTFSTLVKGRSLWTFGDTSMSIKNKYGLNWDDNSMAGATNLDATNGITLDKDYKPGSPAPIEFLPYTPQEAKYNYAHNTAHCTAKPCGAEFAMWGGPIVYDAARNHVLVFYDEIWRISGNSTWKTVGTGIAVGAPDEQFTRPIENPGSKTPNLMWGAKDVAYGCGSVIVSENGMDMLYSYACVLDFVTMNYQVARVPLADALDLSKWTYFAGSGNWSANPADAITIMQAGSAGTSVFYVPYLGEYMAIYNQALSNDLYYRVAYAPEGPWSAQAFLFAGKAGWNNSVDYAGQAHSEFAQQNGAVQFVTYAHTTGLLQQDEPLTKVVFGTP